MLPPDDPIAQDILRCIRQIVRGISIHSKSLQRQVGLTVPQVVCLRAIEKLEKHGCDGITVAAVSTAVQLSPATVSRIMARLTSSGLIARDRNRSDRRKVSLSLTRSGRDRLADLPPALQEIFLQRLDELSAAERKALLVSLRLIVDLMSAGDYDAEPLLIADETI